eukprot:TRINITY_DN441_c0_g1_i8.p1 TRINITY_DN441_c0_g1~~TRINITY_DN441_c0_g1_i8.p1  ORF type:complete len:391 (+),score=64.81 TRINITY_DN441_c0_g1_i8:481-1653(+)
MRKSREARRKEERTIRCLIHLSMTRFICSGDGTRSSGSTKTPTSISSGVSIIVFYQRTIEWRWKKVVARGEEVTARRAHTTVYSELPTPCLIILGGIINYNQLTDELLMFDLQSKEWKRLDCSGEGPSKIAMHTSNIVKEHMYVIGGFCEEKNYNTKVFVLSLETSTWSTLKDVEIGPISAHTAVNFGQNIIIMGGLRPKTAIEKLEEEQFRKGNQREEQKDGSALASTISDGDLAELGQESFAYLPLKAVLILCLGTPISEELKQLTKSNTQLEYDKREFMLSHYLFMNDFVRDKEENEVDPLHYTSKLELKNELPSLVPIEPRDLRIPENIAEIRERARDWCPSLFGVKESAPGNLQATQEVVSSRIYGKAKNYNRKKHSQRLNSLIH